jgi:hypothetical protein
MYKLYEGCSAVEQSTSGWGGGGGAGAHVNQPWQIIFFSVLKGQCHEARK